MTYAHSERALFPPQKRRPPRRYVIEEMRRWIQANPGTMRAKAMQVTIDRLDPNQP